MGDRVGDRAVLGEPGGGRNTAVGVTQSSPCLILPTKKGHVGSAFKGCVCVWEGWSGNGGGALTHSFTNMY